MKPTEKVNLPTATLELSPSGTDWMIGFTIHNPTGQAIDATMHKPFMSFTVAITTDDGTRLVLVQPALDAQVSPVPLHLGPGDSLRLDTPFHLHFDPTVTPAGGEDRFQWSIVSPRVAVNVSAQLSFDGLPPIAAHARLPAG